MAKRSEGFKRRLRDARMRGEALSANELRSYEARKKRNKQMLAEEACATHFASPQNGKICGGCGIHIDSLR